MHKLIPVYLFLIIFISCQKHARFVEKQETADVATNAKDTLPKTEPVSKDSIKADHLISLPFDFEKYTAVCLQQSSPDCEKTYPKLDDFNFKRISQILGNKPEDIPTNIFQIKSSFNNDIEIYILDFEGDSSFQEIITVNHNKIVSRKSVGHSMPEDKTYKSFIIEKDMGISVYELDFESLKKKLKEKYTILSSGEVSRK
ncbi:hypothetical protein NG800_018080 [Epilithonimonas ginsengisoli]|uniref:Lipoprotein n=1 Tax=Epilithonimonas ginsengisoli TaxID=1245592 RepID=A0ABU4JMD1_9FLAO|nr:MULTISPECIES: hypothetical protein [Chryseobacterium group]MBV6881785.1 hypothetical protein [Epilithonimonas sp. FP105]MDW8550841.1 hypothetical protein [Epilithonimonas ginsengisoli]OAH68515.1 hypothetical protein AXA65_17050 [Chryseobacterium sp. FP211-J200]